LRLLLLIFLALPGSWSLTLVNLGLRKNKSDFLESETPILGSVLLY